MPDGTLLAERIGQLIGLEADPAPIEEAAWSTRRLLEALAAERPLVVVFDDLHWAEPTFLDLVERLGEGGDEAPILLVAVARPELLEQRPGLGRRPAQRRQHAAGAAGAGRVGALLDGLAGGGPLPAGARERIARAAGGNPLFIEELLAALVEEGRLRREAGSWVVAGDLAASGTPPTIQALVGARLDRLDGRDRDVLERAAIVGQAFESDTVAEVFRRRPPGTRCRSGCVGWCRREFLRTAPASLPAEAGYQFRHLLVRDAVYQAVPKQVRADLHERLAGLLEARAGARVREYEEIVGYHLEQAWRCRAELGPLDRRGHELGARAAGRLAAAGRRAMARGDTPAATALLDRSVALLPAGHPRLALLLTDLADSLITTGDYRRGDQALTEALAAAGPDDAGLRADVLITRLQMRLTTEPELEFEPLRRQVEEAIAVLERLGDERGLARAWRLLGYERFVQCRIEPAEQAIANAIEHARLAGDERLEAYGRGMLTAAAFWGPLPAAAGIERCRRQLADADGNRYVEASARCALGALVAMQGRFGEAREEVAEGDGHRRNLRPRLPERRLQPVRRRGGVSGRPARRRRDAGAGRRLPRPGAPGRDGRALQRGRRPGPRPARPGPRRRGRGLRRHQPVAGRPRGPVRPGALARRHGPGAGRAGTRRRGRAAGPRGGDPGRAHRHAEPASGRPARPGRDGAGRRPARRRGRRHPRGAGAVRAQGQPGRRRSRPGPPGRRLSIAGLLPAPPSTKIAGTPVPGGGGHAALERLLDGMLLNRLQLELARAVALEQDFHPQDADRLVAIGRGIGNLARLAWDDPEFQGRLNETRVQFANQISGVLREAYGEAGEELVDTELVVALTEALAAAHDPFYGSGR